MKLVLALVLNHDYKHSTGDMIADQDMTMVVYRATETVEALTYQDCFGYRVHSQTLLRQFCRVGNMAQNRLLG